MSVCPKCGYIETLWRATTWKSTQGNQCCRLSDLENENPELAKELREKGEIINGFYAYRLTRNKIWVLRRWIEIWKIQGWKDIPAEKVKKCSNVV